MTDRHPYLRPDRSPTLPATPPSQHTTCTCDTIAEPGFPHRPWCATQHQHPGPDCVGLCEPAVDGPYAAGDAPPLSALIDADGLEVESLRSDLSDAGDVIAQIHEAAEHIDRAFAAYDSLPSVPPPASDGETGGQL